MKKLAIDLTYKPVGGSLAQIKEMINNIDYYRFDNVIFYVSNDNYYLFDGVKNNKISLYRVGFLTKSIIIRTIWVQLLLPFSLIINHVDILFCPGNIAPIFNTKKKVQWVGTVGPFEKNFISVFGWRQRIVLLVTKYLMILSAYTSDIVIFESNYTKELFVRKYKLDFKKSTVLHIGNNEFFKPVETYNSKLLNMKSYKEFILTVSHLYPYKNIELLIDTYHKYQLYNRELCILIAGSIINSSYYNRLKSKVIKYGLVDSIKFLGSVEKHDLRELYSQCKIFVFTSPFENFAYTLVEAMSCSAPIIATNTTAMPETCGNAALYFSPGSEQELANCLFTFLDREDLRRKYKEMSLSKSSEYEVYSVINQRTNKILENLI